MLVAPARLHARVASSLATELPSSFTGGPVFPWGSGFALAYEQPRASDGTSWRPRRRSGARECKEGVIYSGPCGTAHCRGL